MLTTGETPLVSESDGAGAINRVIEIECCPERPVIINAKDMSWEIQRCFGHAGEVYIKRLYSDMSIFGYLKKRYDALFDELAASDTTEKQAMAAAMIVVADELITEWFFHDKAITVADIATTLKSRETVDVGKRGYNYMCDWVAQNSLKMRQGIESGDIYGLIDGDIAYIIRSVFDQAAAKGGFNPSVLLSYFKSNNLIDARIKGNTRPKRIGGGVVNCVCLRLPVISDEATDEVTI